MLGYSFYPVHPGEVIKDELEARHISQRAFARQVNVSYTALNELLNGKRPLTPTTALMFEAALDIRSILSWLARIPKVAAML